MIDTNFSRQKFAFVWMVLFCIVLHGQDKSDSTELEYHLNGEEVYLQEEEELQLPDYKGYKEIRIVEEGFVPLTIVTLEDGEIPIKTLLRNQVAIPEMENAGEFSLYLEKVSFPDDGKVKIFYGSPNAYNNPQSSSSWELQKNETFEIWKQKSKVRAEKGSVIWTEKEWREAFEKALDKSKLGRDSTRSRFDIQYGRDFFLEAEITQYKDYALGSYFRPSYEKWLDGMKIEINWILTDMYGAVLAEVETTSPLMLFRRGLMKGQASPPQLDDAILYSLVELLKETTFLEALDDAEKKSVKEEHVALFISKSKKTASNLTEASKACLTVIHKDTGHSSGFIISEDGYFLTTLTAIFEKEDIQVILEDGTYHPAELVRQSKEANLALMKFEGSNCHSLQQEGLSSDKVIGTTIYAVGTPTASDLGQSLSKGIVSGLREVNDQRELLQTDARVSPGYRGGALVTKDGRCVGMIIGKIIEFGVEGVVFGLPFSEAVEELNLKFK